MLLAHAPLRRPRRRRPEPAPARHPAHRHRPHPALGYAISAIRRRGLRAGQHRPSSASPRWPSLRRRMLAGPVLGKAAPATARWLACLLGFALWAYTLMLPSVAKSGWLAAGFLHDGPWGIALLKPEAPVRLERARQPDPLPCSGACWPTSSPSSRCHSGGPPSAREASQALLFVDVFSRRRRARRGGPGVLGAGGPRFASCCRWPAASSARLAPGSCSANSRTGVAPRRSSRFRPTAQLVQFVETQLAGAIGSASARVMVAAAGRGGNARAGRRHAHSSTRPRNCRAYSHSSRTSRARSNRRRPTCARPTNSSRAWTG